MTGWTLYVNVPTKQHARTWARTASKYGYEWRIKPTGNGYRVDVRPTW